MTTTYRIVEINLGLSRWDSSFSFSMGDTHFEVESYSLDFNIEAGKDLIRKLSNQVDAIALTGFPPRVVLGNKSFSHRQFLEVLRVPTSIPVCTGDHVSTISVIKSLMQLIENKTIQPKKGIFFPSGIMSLDAVRVLSDKYADHLYYGDAFLLASLPITLKHSDHIRYLSRTALMVANMVKMKNATYATSNPLNSAARKILKEQIKDVEHVYSRMSFLAYCGEDLDLVKNKKLIVPYSHPKIEKHIRQFEPSQIINLFPEKFLKSEYMNYSILDAALRLKYNKTAPLSMREWEDLLEVETEAQFTSRRYLMNQKNSLDLKINELGSKIKRKIISKEQPDFAFVVHALSLGDLARTPGFSFLKSLSPENLLRVEKMASKAPGFTYGRVENVISKSTGKRVNGIIYALTSTPRMLKTQPVEEVYNKIHKLCIDAADKGAKIIGLGAYTKVVGDSGETINQMSPIPVTTGNSLSASATLWAVFDVVTKMGLLDFNPETKKFNGMATVVGATGSIGRVSAKLLSLAFKDICLVAPRMERLEELAQEIRALSPDCRVYMSTDANTFAGITDVLVTATSAVDEKIIDVENLKPGCVVCDCSRPLDFTIEDAIKRPDVLIIESGEVILPGPNRITCDLGLPGNIVYACLGETVTLALEERFEPFTLGRDLDWLKVKEIYKMARKHGVSLASIRGHAGFIYDKEIQLVKQLALQKRKSKSNFSISLK